MGKRAPFTFWMKSGWVPKFQETCPGEKRPLESSAPRPAVDGRPRPTRPARGHVRGPISASRSAESRPSARLPLLDFPPVSPSARLRTREASSAQHPTQSPTCADPRFPPRPPIPLIGKPRPAPCAVTLGAAVSRRWGGSVWGRMAAAAVTRGTPGGKSQGLSPASPPPRQGAQLQRPGRGAPCRGTTVPPPGSPHSLLPSSSPAPGGAARRRAPRRTCLGFRGSRHPHCSLPAARPWADLPRSLSRTSIRAGGRRVLPTS